MIAQIFNSSLISGPETLVLPNLQHLKSESCVIWLREERSDPRQNAAVEKEFRRFATTHIIPVRDRRDPRAAIELRELLHRLPVRFAQAHDVKASFVLDASGPADRYFRLSTHHGVFARSGLKVRLYEQYYSRFILPRLDAGLTVCRSDREVLLRRGLNPEKIFLHLNGVDRPELDPAARLEKQAHVRRQWKIEANGDLLFGVAARLSPEKDHERLLRVLSLYPGLPFRLLCFGTGPLESHLRRRTRELGLEHKVEWRGYQDGLGQQMAGLDGLLSFSKHEGLPINLLEAAWAGTPILASRVDGVADLIPNETTGLTFPAKATEAEVAELFRRFVSHPAESQAKAWALQARVREHFSGRRWAERLEEITMTISSRRKI